MLGDNGVVYELVLKKEQMNFITGFGKYADDGTVGTFKPTHYFKVSKDQDAQEDDKEFLEIISNNYILKLIIVILRSDKNVR